MQTQFQLGSYIHETYSLANLQDLIYTSAVIRNYRQHQLAKVGMKPCVDLLENVFHLCMHEGNCLAEIVLHEQT